MRPAARGDAGAGRVRGCRASPGAMDKNRFDEDDAPRSRFPRALRLAALFGPCRIVPGPLPGPGVGTEVPVVPGSLRPRARGEQ